jgi:Uma2 family endonuclease
MSDMANSIAGNVRTRHIDVDEYYRMAEVGILRPDERVELLNGRIIEMPPIGPRHAYAVAALQDALQTALRGRAVISSQAPVRLDRISEPQPDIRIVVGPRERYADVHPNPGDALLLVEVADSTLAHDSGEKLRAYARARVLEYWVVDLVHERIDVYGDPEGERYDAHRIVGRGEFIAPQAFPNDSIAVDDILPPSP